MNEDNAHGSYRSQTYADQSSPEQGDETVENNPQIASEDSKMNWKGIIASQIICIPFFKRPFQSLPLPQAYGVQNACDFKISLPSGDHISAWLMLASVEHHDDPFNIVEGDQKFKEDDQVVLYLHGNAETRSQKHRVELYKKFQEWGLHVLAVDYRGYADSSWVKPNENTMMADGLAALKWLKGKCQASTKVLLWGHSLGTGVSSKLMAHIKSEQLFPSHVILESPFNNMYDEVMTYKIAHPIGLVMDIPGWLREAECEFASDVWIRSVKRPVLIMHARNDWVVPFKLGEQLFKSAKDAGVNVQFKEFESFGHDGIWQAPNLGEIVSEFIK